MSPQTRTSILVADDSAVIQTILREMLTHWGYDVVVTSDGVEAWDVLRKPARPNLAIVDLVMPRLRGPDLCRRLRAETPDPYTYVLMLTARTELSDIIEGFDAGVDDYLTKPFHAQELWARLRTGIRTIGIQQELAEAREALRRSTVTDQLTGLANRRAVLLALDEALAQSDREERPMSILLVKIDRLGQINASFGREAGDTVLCECADRVRGVRLEAGTIGRCGGRKFLVLLPGADAIDATAAAERVRAAVSAEMVHAGAASFPVSCSIGVATHTPGTFSDSGFLLSAAAQAFRVAAAASPAPA